MIRAAALFFVTPESTDGITMRSIAVSRSRSPTHPSTTIPFIITH